MGRAGFNDGAPRLPLLIPGPAFPKRVRVGSHQAWNEPRMTGKYVFSGFSDDKVYRLQQSKGDSRGTGTGVFR